MATSTAQVIDICPSCGAYLLRSGNFCTDCGVALAQPHTQPRPLAENFKSQHHAAAHGFAQAFSLNPAPAFFAIFVDAMVSAIDVSTLGITAPVLWFIAGMVTAAVVFMAQRKWGGDDNESAATKALMVGFLVALPTPFPSLLTVPSAVVGTLQLLRNKK